MKKALWLIVGILMIAGIYFGWAYYNDTYVGHTAFAVVPSKVPSRKKTVDDSGKVVAGYHSYSYKLKFIYPNGKAIVLSYYLEGENPKPLTPKSVVKANISKKRIINGPHYVHESNIPSSIKTKLNSTHQ